MEGEEPKDNTSALPEKAEGPKPPRRSAGGSAESRAADLGMPPKAPDPLTRRGKSVPVPPWAGAATAFTAMALWFYSNIPEKR